MLQTPSNKTVCPEGKGSLASSSEMYVLQMSPFMMVLLVMMFCLRSHLRVQQWSSERDLYQSALDVCPLNAKVHYNLAKTSSHYMEAMKHYRQALW